MKLVKLSTTIVAAAIAALGFSRGAYAFHDGGVAGCEGCHTMHNSKGGQAVAIHPGAEEGPGTSTQFQGKTYLLQGSDQSSTCLNCHANSQADAAAANAGPGVRAANSFHVMTYPLPAVGTQIKEFTPGGDFAWLNKTFTWSVSWIPGVTISEAGERHGHNVVAFDYGMGPDSTLTTSPGGNYSAASLMCTSCHDPHSRARYTTTGLATSALGSNTDPITQSGSYGAAPTAGKAVGVYRFLGARNYKTLSGGGPAFTADPPVVVAPSNYNLQEGAGVDVHVAYGQGMSEWCANCHGSIHNDSTGAANTNFIHPAGNGALLTAAANDLAGNPTGTTIATIYNDYRSSGHLSGTSADSYLSLVPYEEGSADRTFLTGRASSTGSTASKVGPVVGTENVMCLSCHRAHASGFSSMTRFETGEDMTTTAAGLYPDWPTSGSTAAHGKSAAEYQDALYGRPPTVWGYSQRALCNKCHAKD